MVTNSLLSQTCTACFFFFVSNFRILLPATAIFILLLDSGLQFPFPKLENSQDRLQWPHASLSMTLISKHQNHVVVIILLMLSCMHKHIGLEKQGESIMIVCLLMLAKSIQSRQLIHYPPALGHSLVPAQGCKLSQERDSVVGCSACLSSSSSLTLKLGVLCF